ncbi:hypothetical protein KUD11_08065 [Roseovarius sp. LXJ103]|uniref:DUF6925 family protein n=1 Tax=Roseovarius carneus TaxID=2853164 RepID=UPI000D6168CB|nr:hypothetical protein [Roseovarius carneus]MBZ8118604.1 hypothetical protein [Roseovarius carneus]PWE35708.1 hypothetical protein DD563_06895 [Pelagicola sp. LXJ1103]
MTNLEQILHDAMAHPEAGWNMGSFGAIAEFHHVRDEAPRLPIMSGTPQSPDTPLSQVSTRGGLRLDTLKNVRPVAYETLSPKAHRWSQGVALCLPEAEAAMSRRSVLTELGPDAAALRPEDRGAILFDMGLAQPQVDFCIRTDDAALIDVLRAAEGASLMDPANPAMGAILKAHPHRVALTKLGRVEVFQPIGGPDTDGTSPEGPHTHVLPKLLRAARTHSANTPIPEGWVPCAGFHPENPVIGRLGEDKPLNRAAFDGFQELLRDWGPPEYVEAKAACWAALEQGTAPKTVDEPATRIGRTGLRNGLRQWRRLHGDSPLAAAWSAHFDNTAVPQNAVDETAEP